MMKSRTVRIVNVVLVLVCLGLCVACGGVRQAAARSQRRRDEADRVLLQLQRIHGGQPPKDADELMQAAGDRTPRTSWP
jgi:hypothetical protein